MYHKILICFWAFGLVGSVYAQTAEPLLFTHITEENGLSDNHVTAVLKDAEGLVWIGTEDGLNLLDGSTIRIFRHKTDDSTSLPANDITMITQDSARNIWIGTGSGLSCLKKGEDRFQNFFPKGNSYGGAVNIITGISINKNILWVATDGGLFRMDATTGRQTILLCGDAEPLIKRRACNEITEMVQDEAGTLWLCTHNGLWSYHPDNNRFYKEISPANDPAFDPLLLSVADADEQLWIGTWGKGIKQFDKRTKKTTTYNGDGNAVSCLSTAFTQPDGRSIYWLNGNLKTFDPNAKVFRQVPAGENPDDPNATAVYVSKDNRVWFCTGNGLYIYNPYRQTFHHTVFKTNITSQGVVLAEVENRLLIGGGNRFLLRAYNDSMQETADYSPALFHHAGTANAEALAFRTMDPQNWWIGTSHGLVYYHTTSQQVKWFVHNNNDSNSLPRNFISCLYVDQQKTIWVFPWREGVWQLDPATGKCRKIIDGISTIASVKKKLVIADVAEDAAGNLWLADMDEGIIFYERNSNRFSKPFSAVIGDAPQTLRIHFVNGFFYTVANNVLVRWRDKAHCEVVPFPEEMRRKVYDYVPDQQGNFWFITKNGLVYYDVKTNVFKRFTTADGLYRNDLDGSIFCRHTGEMLIASADFMTTFHPQKLIIAAPVVPAILLTGFYANSDRLPIPADHTINLGYHQNNIQVNWALPDYTSPFKNRYYYMLKGIDSGWRYTGNRGEIQYANLSPGHYTILLSATDANGDTAPNIILLNMHIHPPFWKSPWFIAFIFFILGLLVFLLVSRHIRRIQTKAAIDQQMAVLEMKALQAQMNPHFIFNSLNSIQECIIMNNTEAAYTYLGKFSKLVRRILENSGKLFVSLKEEMEMLQWYVQLEQLRFKDPVDFSIQIADTIDVENIQVPAMILQPFIENALWHGLAAKTGSKILQLSFSVTNSGIECIVEDNGAGRSRPTAQPAERKERKSMGMMITRERLALFHQHARFETIDLLDENQQPAGTRIVIYLPVE